MVLSMSPDEKDVIDISKPHEVSFLEFLRIHESTLCTNGRS